MKNLVDIPPVWATLAAALSAALAYFIPLYPFTLPLLVPVAVAGLGFAIVGWSALWFWHKKTTIEPRHTPTALIIEGPYRLNRNPIYTGMVLVLLGFALWLGDPVALLPVAAFPLIITYRFILAEEQSLRTAFGKAADTYLARSRRWGITPR